VSEIRKWLQRLVKDDVCRYSKGCPLFNKDAYTCNHDDEASGGNCGKPYCGRFRMIEGCKHKKQICKITGYDTVAMICKDCGYHVRDGTVVQKQKQKQQFS